ncbi:MAG TPA: MFS transporter [Gaiellaceae bacterium]
MRLSPAARNAILLSGGLVCLSGMIQLAVALGTVTLVAVTGVEGILGLGPAVFLVAGGLAVGPAGRISDRVGRMPVIRAGFLFGILGPVLTALGCWSTSGELVFLGLGCCGAAQGIVLLSRAAAAEMFPPEHRARGISLVLFGAVSGAVFGPLIFGPIFAGSELTPDDLAWPWLGSSLFALAGLLITFAVRPDPKELSRQFVTEAEETAAAAPLAEIVRRPGVLTAMLAAVVSFAVMAGVMNLAGYVAVGHGHEHGDVFTVISAHIVGMFGLVLAVGPAVDVIGRTRAMALGLGLMAVSNAGLLWLDSIAGMSLSLFGLGLGWNLAYVAATAQLVSLASPVERGGLVGLTDLTASLTAAFLALGGGVVYTASGSVPLAAIAALLAALPAFWIVLLPSAVGGRIVRRLSVMKTSG